MSYLLDTNILLRTIVTDDPNYHITMEAIASLRRSGERLFVAPQNLIELWNVATRPAAKNGLGISPLEAAAEIARLKELFILLPDTEQIYPEWERLVKTYEVKGVNVHDTRLVAFMLVHRLSHILTFNVKDFRRFSTEITSVSPKEVGSIDESE
ncbi:type II toxin-antitoxin system VapC family toxin [Pleurocapsa sp. FMAR1]|uniref:type II toxin-antitoxin system VapC family toxin n=1 Tax=Pleurocapsa sp. FMAR1 TaxID=3040204 RepID=UPI0029C6E468|nr:type II toxin-antitoxin system VapC family toxin [Pleurocapsa sp. FMAR1]